MVWENIESGRPDLPACRVRLVSDVRGHGWMFLVNTHARIAARFFPESRIDRSRWCRPALRIHSVLEIGR